MISYSHLNRGDIGKQNHTCKMEFKKHDSHFHFVWRSPGGREGVTSKKTVTHPEEKKPVSNLPWGWGRRDKQWYAWGPLFRKQVNKTSKEEGGGEGGGRIANQNGGNRFWLTATAGCGMRQLDHQTWKSKTDTRLSATCIKDRVGANSQKTLLCVLLSKRPEKGLGGGGKHWKRSMRKLRESFLRPSEFVWFVIYEIGSTWSRIRKYAF